MAKKSEKTLYRSYEDIISELPDGTVYPCVDDPNYGRQTKKGKIIGCIKGDGYWVGGASINREDVELVSEKEIVKVIEIPRIEQELISPDLQTVESRLASVEAEIDDEDITRMVKQSGKTPSKYQRAIYKEVKDGSGNVVIEARAGSGKTTTLVNALKLIPKNKKILVSAFNVKIAAELRARCPSNVDVMTLHGFGLRQLKKHLAEKGQLESDEYEDVDDGLGEKVIKGKGREFIIDSRGYYMRRFIDSTLSSMLLDRVGLREVMKLVGYLIDCLNLAQAYAIRPDSEDFVFKMRNHISSRIIKDSKEEKALMEKLELTSAKDSLFKQDGFVKLGLKYSVIDFGVGMTFAMLRYALSPVKKSIKEEYVNGEIRQVPVEAMAYSFNDMIYITAVSDKINVDQYDYVFIDEAQDMNIAQITMLVKAGNKARIFVIGDPRQAIYLFNYSELDMMQRMEKILNAKKLYLSVSYRVPRSVAEVAKKCVKDFEVPDTAIEGEVTQIEASEMIDSLRPGDVVIARKNAALKSVTNFLVARNIPVILLGLDNYDKVLEKIIKDAAKGAPKNSGIAQIITEKKTVLEKEIDSYEDALSAKSKARMIDSLLSNGLNRNRLYDNRKQELGYGQIQSLVYAQRGIAKENLNSIDFVETLMASLKTDNLEEIVKRAKSLIGNYPRIDANEIRRATQAEARQIFEGYERRKARDMEKYVVLTTVHKFKGSEADRVFVLEDTFSSRCDYEYSPETAEEDNLYYVAVTRAKKQLFLVSGEFIMDEEAKEEKSMD